MPIVVQVSAPSASTASSQGIDAGDILQTFIRECGDRPPDGVLALRWLNRRYRQIWQSSNWQFAQKEGTFLTVARINAGTVTVTNGSATVAETTSNANGWTSSVVSRKWRRTGDNVFYDISAFGNDNPDTLTLDRVYEGTTGTVTGYTIFQNIYSLNEEVGVLHTITSRDDRFRLTETSREELDTAFPNRSNVDNPRWFAPFGRDSNDIQRIELYPSPIDAEGFIYHYTQEGPFIVGGNAKIVPQVFEGLLQHGWQSNYWRWRATQDDARGNETGLARDEEILFAKELGEMMMREAQNQPPKRVPMAAIYTAHRRIRGDKYGITDRKAQMPLNP